MEYSTTVATYSYDTFGTPTIWESFSSGWHNPFLYDGHDGARYDGETGLYWLSVRAYDPTLGRFISRDPLGRAPLFFDASQPYVYGGNNPLTNVDPGGQWGRRQMFDNDDWKPHPLRVPFTGRITIVRPSSRANGGGQSQAKPGLPGWLQGVATLLISSGVSLWQMQKAKSAQLAEYAVLDHMDQALEQLKYFGKSWAQVWKSMAFRRGSQALENALGKIKFYENLGKALWLIGGAVDWFTFTWSYFHSSMRPDLTGWTRLAVAVVAGLLHGVFVTIVGWGSTVGLTFLFGPFAGWALGAAAGYLAGLFADWALPKLIDMIVPIQYQPAHA